VQHNSFHSLLVGLGARHGKYVFLMCNSNSAGTGTNLTFMLRFLFIFTFAYLATVREVGGRFLSNCASVWLFFSMVLTDDDLKHIKH